MKRSRQLTLKQCHEILRLDKNAGLEELKSAYRKRAFELHPDLNPGNPNASHDFQLLNEAYVALSAVLKPAEEARQKAEEARQKAEESRRRAQESREERRRAEERARDAAESRRAREERERIIREQAEKRRAEERARDAAESRRAREERERLIREQVEKRRAEEQARARREEQQAQQPRPEAAAHDEKEAQDAGKDFQQSGYAEQDVLRDLLNDPFARRVFEDIYSELNRQEREKPHTEEHVHEAAAEEPSAAEAKETTTDKRRERIRKEEAQEVTVTWSDKKPGFSLRKGVAGAFKGWLRQQIDEEQEFTLPASNLVPGRRIRLRIRRGFSNDLVTVEITLPPDFVPGKPVRLRGLGKRVGPWQGDLYLKLNSQ